MGYRYVVLVAVAAAGLLVAGSAFATKSDHWVVMDLGTRGSTTESFERLGQPITPGQVACLTNNYRARTQLLYFALRVGDGPTRVTVLESPSLPAGGFKSTKLSGSPVGDVLFESAEACLIPLEL